MRAVMRFPDDDEIRERQGRAEQMQEVWIRAGVGVVGAALLLGGAAMVWGFWGMVAAFGAILLLTSLR